MKQGITLSNFMYCFLTFFAFTAMSHAQVVTSGADDGSDGTLRAEINDTPAGGTITFSVTSITLNEEIVLDKDLTITGEVSIDAASKSRIFNISSGSIILDGLSITNGMAENGGAILLMNADLELNNVSISNSVATGDSGSGGAIFVGNGAMLTATNSTFENNRANRAGGAIEGDYGNALGIILKDSNFKANNAGIAPATASPGNGGAIHITGAGNIDVTGGIFEENIAASEGGALWNGTGTMTIAGAKILSNIASGNDADTGGGGVFNNGGTVKISENTELSLNKANGALGSGGALLTIDGSVTLDNARLVSNIAIRAGGAIEIIKGTLDLNFSKFINNRFDVSKAAPGNGGAVHVSGAAIVNVTGGEYNGSRAVRDGGAFWNEAGAIMNLKDSVIVRESVSYGGSSNNGGAGIYNNGGEVNLSNGVQLFYNHAMGPVGSGGAILSNGGTINLLNTHIAENDANRAGAGIEMIGGTLNVTTSSIRLNFFENAAPGNGAGVHVTGNGTVNFEGGNVWGNVATNEGGGLWNGSGTMTINGTEFYGNVAQGNTVSDPLEIKGGGAIFANDNGSLIINEGTNFHGNFATGTGGSGGAILLAVNTSLKMNGTEENPVLINDNGANRAGGGIEDWSLDAEVSTLKNVHFMGNSAGVNIEGFTATAAPGNGGAIHITGSGSMEITGGMATANKAAAEGGAFWNSIQSMTVDGTFFEGNSASGADATNGGGALFNNGGTLIVTNVNIKNNSADGTTGSGGGIQNVDGGKLTITNSEIAGNSANRAGGGIEDNSSTMMGTLELNNVRLLNNTTGSSPGNGGGLHITGNGTAALMDGEVSGNTAANEGGGLWNGAGTMTITGTLISANTANGNTVADPLDIKGGGGIYALNDGMLIIKEGTVFDSNYAPGAGGSGGAILLDNGAQLTITGTQDSPVIFSNNAANRAGGAIEDWSLDTAISMLDYVNFSGNSAGVSIEGFSATAAPGNGGAIHITGNGDMEINNSFASQNLAAAEGGAFWNSLGTLTVYDSTFEENTASGADATNGGGALFNNGGTLNVWNSFITKNKADGASGSGGGIQNVDGGSITVNNTIIAENSAIRAGGGIEDNSTNAAGSIRLKDVTLDSNTTGAAPGNGGGFHITGPGNSWIETSTVSNNYAANQGGGVWNGSGTMRISTSTISGNTSDGTGGGIYNLAGSVFVSAATVVLNEAAATGGGVDNPDGSTVTLRNSIVARNMASSGMDLGNAGTYVSSDYNLIGQDDTDVFSAKSNDSEGTSASPIDPMIDVLADNGGPTQTHALLEGSIAYNAANPNDTDLDQRGEAVFGGRRDMGAFEAQMSLGVDDVIAASLSNSVVYPNPSTGSTVRVNIPGEITSTVNISVIEIGSGKMVLSQQGTSGINELQVGSLSAGTYILRLVTGKTVESLKMVLGR